MEHSHYRVVKSFMGVDVSGLVPTGRWWFNVDSVFEVVEEVQDEDGRQAVSVRTPGTVGLFMVRKSKIARQCVAISDEDWEMVIRVLDLPMWSYSAPHDQEATLWPWQDEMVSDGKDF